MREQPNILFIMTDQQRTDSLGCYGSTCIKTPHIDQLAAKGTLFDHCYANNTICTPSRASLFTGKHLPGHGVYQVYDQLPDSEKLFPHTLQEAGYQTALFGKLHVSGRTFEKDRRNKRDGFEIYEHGINPYEVTGLYNSYGDWLKERHPGVYERIRQQKRGAGHIEAEAHFTAWAAERTVDFIKHRRDGRPFFCYMSVLDPHDPYGSYPLECADRVDAERIPEPRGKGDGPLTRAHRAEHEHNYLGGYDGYTREDIMKMRLGYHAAVAFVDEQVGKVVAALKEAGIWDNTAIVFTSDHGDMLGDHGVLVKGATFFDEATKVPLIVRLPGQTTGKRVASIVQLHDLAATMLGLAGVDPQTIAADMPDSRPLPGLHDADGREERARDYAVCLYRNSGISDQKRHFDPPIHGSMLRTNRFKLTVYHDGADSPEQPAGELYDMANDPSEQINLWFDPGMLQVKQQLVLQLTNWIVSQEIGSLGGRGGRDLPDKTQTYELKAF